MHLTNECAVTLADVLLRRVPVALGRVLVILVQPRSGNADCAGFGME